MVWVSDTRLGDMNPQTWLQEHGDVLYRFALSRCKDPDVASDLVQDTLLSAWKSHTSFAGESTVRTWLIGILKHKWIDHLRKTHLRKTIRQREHVQEAEGDPTAWFDHNNGAWKEKPSAWGDDPAMLCQNQQFLGTLKNCVEQLPNQQALVFDLRELHGLDAEEVCKVCDISATNLHVILHRARLRLRSCLDNHWFGK